MAEQFTIFYGPSSITGTPVRDLPKTLDNIRLANVEAITEAEFTERRMKLVALGELNQAIVRLHGAAEHHPWHGVTATEINLFDQEELIAHGERVKSCAQYILRSNTGA